MADILVIHWKQAEIGNRLEKLIKDGHHVTVETPEGRDFIKKLREHPPQIIIIDLSRLPSQGRDLSFHFRRMKAFRNIPIIFAEGAEPKLARIKEVLPDAYYSSWDVMTDTVKTALAEPISSPVVPDSLFAAYKDKNLTSKLGIDPGMKVLVINPDPEVIELIGKNTAIEFLYKKEEGKVDLIIAFCRSLEQLNDLISRKKTLAEVPFWIAWQKKSSGIRTELNQNIVRQMGLNAGYVDYKICSMNKIWSGLLFRKRKRS